MTVNRYRKRPVAISAIEYIGANWAEVVEFCNKTKVDCWRDDCSDKLIIVTPKGNHQASIGDMIIRGVKGECYSCRSDIFKLTYEKL